MFLKQYETGTHEVLICFFMSQYFEGTSKQLTEAFEALKTVDNTKPYCWQIWLDKSGIVLTDIGDFVLSIHGFYEMHGFNLNWPDYFLDSYSEMNSELINATEVEVAKVLEDLEVILASNPSVPEIREWLKLSKKTILGE